MKLIRLENILRSLQEMSFQVRVPDELRDTARKSVEKMLRIR
jgi:quinolinate synthase